MKKEAENPIIVALDGEDDAGAAMKVAEILSQFKPVYKANDLLDDPGPGILSELAKHGIPFADAKYKDIPDTMARRVRKMSAVVGEGFITIMGDNTVKAMKAAVDNRGKANILVVTVLTSMNEEDCNDTYGRPVKAVVLRFARNAVLAGAQGIVCSAKELEFLAGYPELNDLIKVTPGIRPIWYQDATKKADDQKRTMTPGKAMKLGANFLVMGRPILRAEGFSPIEAMQKTLAEIADAKAG